MRKGRGGVDENTTIKKFTLYITLRFETYVKNKTMLWRFELFIIL